MIKEDVDDEDEDDNTRKSYKIIYELVCWCLCMKTRLFVVFLLFQSCLTAHSHTHMYAHRTRLGQSLGEFIRTFDNITGRRLSLCVFVHSYKYLFVIYSSHTFRVRIHSHTHRDHNCNQSNHTTNILPRHTLV